MRLMQAQRGVAVLPVVVMLLAGAALILLFAQKNLLLDMRITQNSYQNRLAYAAADSGLVAVLARLNDANERAGLLTEKNGSGAYDTLATSLVNVPLGDDDVNANVKLQALALGGPDVRLQLQSTGCVGDCSAASASKATVTQTIALRGGIQQLPYALLTARGGINVSGPVALNNQTAAVRGMLLHAGGAIARDKAVQRNSLPGQNPDLAEVALDSKFAQSADDFFRQWFGADKAFVRQQATIINCQGECSGAVATAVSATNTSNVRRVIWLDGDARLSGGSLGSASAPVIVIAAGNLQISGAARIIGIVYSMAPLTVVQLDVGSLDGALIAENLLDVTQGGLFSYNPVVLQRAQSSLGRFVPIPGSWSDGE